MRCIVILISALALDGCVSENTMLVNKDGKMTVCNAQGWGWIGAPVAANMHHDCLQKAHAAGYWESQERASVEAQKAAATAAAQATPK